MKTADFDFELPPELIAQQPAPVRDGSRLLILNRASGVVEHRQFGDLLSYLRAGDLLVLNNSRVIPARLRAANALSGGKFEILLVTENARNDWWCLVHPGKRARPETRLILLDHQGRNTAVQAIVLERNESGHRRLRFEGAPDVAQLLDEFGEVPLPPYIHRTGRPTELDERRYQTVFARTPGSIAAPTAGLHFTEHLLDSLRARGVRVEFVTLHVGLATFTPVKTENIEEHPMHEERYDMDGVTAEAIAQTRAEGGRVIAGGTTTVRVLESVAAEHDGIVKEGAGRTRLFMYPPYRFQVVDGLLTNFHLPRSTLLMLVSALAAPGETRGRETVLRAYGEAIRNRYRFFSYGDAMLLI